jgi:hypothetical protein
MKETIASQGMSVLASHALQMVVPASMMRITTSTYPGIDVVMDLTMNLYSVKGKGPLADASVLIKRETEYLVSKSGLWQKT